MPICVAKIERSAYTAWSSISDMKNVTRSHFAGIINQRRLSNGTLL